MKQALPPPPSDLLFQRPFTGHSAETLHRLVMRFGLLVAVNLVVLLVLVSVLTQAAGTRLSLGLVVGLGLYGAVNLFLHRGFVRHYPHERLGLCNVVTHFRATLTAVLAAMIPAAAAFPGTPALAWTVAGIAALALVSDGIDGWAARRSGLVSAFGARFDMEVDSVLALTLALILWQAGTVGPWVILLGLPRYLFVVAMWIWPWIDKPTPARFSGKLVCVIQITALIVLVTPVLSPPVSQLVAAGALALVVWSFAVDLLWLWRKRVA